MHPDEIYRAFLLGTADPETEAEVEDSILDGEIDTAYLNQIEEELIDDLLFGRLSTMEEKLFRAKLECSPERTAKLEFTRALQAYALGSVPDAVRPSPLARLRVWAMAPWVLPLAGALGCAVLTIAWLGERNRSLHMELAQAIRTTEEQQRLARQPIAPSPLVKPNSVAPIKPETAVQPVFHLSTGIVRGVAAVPVLHLDAHAETASIVLVLRFEPAAMLREELTNADGETVWKQEFQVKEGMVSHDAVNVLIPAALLPTGEYHLRVENIVANEEHGDHAETLFRVRRD